MAASLAILTEASCDLSAQRLSELDVTAIPMPMKVNGQAFQHCPNGRNLSFEDYYAKLLEAVAERAADLKDQVVYIIHADVREIAESLAQRIRLAGARETVITLLGLRSPGISGWAASGSPSWPAPADAVRPGGEASNG